MLSLTITILIALSLFLGVGGGDVHPMMNSTSTNNSSNSIVIIDSPELHFSAGNELDILPSFSATNYCSGPESKEESTFEVKIIATFTSSGRLVSVRPVRDTESEHGALVLFDDRLTKIKVLFDRERLYSKYFLHLFIIVDCIVYITFFRKRKEKPSRPKKLHIYLRRLS